MSKGIEEPAADITSEPPSAEDYFNLGNISHRAGDLDKAAALYRRALEIAPDHAKSHNNLGAALNEQGRLNAAIASYRHAIALDPNHERAHYNLGLALQTQGEFNEAAASFRAAVKLRPSYAKAHYNLASLSSLNERSPANVAAFASLAEQVKKIDSFRPQERTMLLFAMSKSLESRGVFDEAFSYMKLANAAMRSSLSFDIGATNHRMATIAEVFSKSLLDSLAGVGSCSERPIFIVGMARSGTTLVEQIISSHPKVRGGGENPSLPSLVASTRGADGSAYPLWVRALTKTNCAAIGQAYLQSLPPSVPDELRTTDKTLSNIENLGLIQLCLPQARIIHCQRDPRDVCVSCFASRFSDGQEYAYDLTELGMYWRAYDRLMTHWKAVLRPGWMFEISYEALVQDVEPHARRLIAYCGLDWDDACLRFFESRREVRTASFAQVRKPIYTESVGRWRRFATHLGPLLDALGEDWRQ